MPASRRVSPVEREMERRRERARWPRYHQGWQLYLKAADPERAADIVVDNDDLACPRLVRTCP